jgi:hypothetical protein
MAETVKQLLNEYSAYRISYGEVETETIFDDAKGHYELMHVGWIGRRRIHSCLLHVDIRDGKIWIQRGGTEGGIANDLVEAGIPRDQIVLAFHHPETRKLTDFAVT